MTTDNGILILGHRNFDHYTTPLLCIEAAQMEEEVQRRTQAAQTLADSLRTMAPERDTVPLSVVTVARMCGARFLSQPVTRWTIRDLPDLFDLALLAQNDSLAHTVLGQWVAVASTDSARQSVLLQGLMRYLHAEPARVAAAESIVTWLDRQGAAAQPARQVAHARLLEFGAQTFDRQRMRQEAEHAIAQAKDMTVKMDPSWRGETLFRAYGTLLKLVFVDQINAPAWRDSLRSVAQRLQQDFHQSPLRQGKVVPYTGERLATAPIDSLVQWLSERVGIITDGRLTPRVTASFWVSDRDTVQPAAGVVSLLVHPIKECYDEELRFSWASFACEQAMTRVTRWQQEYGAAGLSVAVVTWTHGHSLYSGPQTPAEEAKNIGWYVQMFRHLPVPVAVQAVSVSHKPQPDGTLVRDAAEFARAYGYEKGNDSFDGFVVLTGRDGRLLYVGNDNDPMLDALLARLYVPVLPAAAVATPRSPSISTKDSPIANPLQVHRTPVTPAVTP